MATVRYIVDDVDAALEFYRSDLEFEEVMHPAPTFAVLRRGDQILLEDPSGNPVELFQPTRPEAASGSA